MISFNQKFAQWFNLEILGEFKHQNTSQIINFQNDFLGIEKRRWQLSNDQDIPIIQSKQGSIGLSFKKQDWLINAVGFLKEVSGITTQSQGFLDQYEFVRSSGKYEAYGAEFLIRRQLNRWNMWMSYGYLDSQYLFENLPEPEFRSNFDITHSISSGITFSTNTLHMAVGLNWRTGRPYTEPVAGNEVVDEAINYSEVNSAKLKDYFRVDISAIYRTKLNGKTRLHTGVSVWNLLDRQNTVNAFYRIANISSTQQVEQNSLGVTPNLMLKLLFD